MFVTLVNKELKAILQSPKFVATFIVCSLLMLLSVQIGINEYKASVNKYQAAQSLIDQRKQEMTTWESVSDKVLRKPDPLQIFVSGVENDLGRWSRITNDDPVKLESSNYSEEPIYAFFRFIDFGFIVQVVLSLIAILFTYDAVSGERESGTLKLVFSNPVPRVKYLTAKCVGAWLGLVIPILIPILICLLLTTVSGIPMTGTHWGKLTGILFISILFFTFFVIMGVFISTLTRQSRTSFLYALVLWIAFVLIVPRAGVLTAAQIVPVPSVAEIEGQQDAFAKDRWAEFHKGSEERWAYRMEHLERDEDGKTFIDQDRMWNIMNEEDSIRGITEAQIDEYQIMLHDDLRKKTAERERLGLTLSRFSPASSYQLATMNIAGTDIDMKNRYEDALNEFRGDFNGLVDEKKKENPLAGGVIITMDTETGFNIRQPNESPVIDLSVLPVFSTQERTLAETLAPSVIDFGIIIIYALVAFIGAFMAFLRYDVR